MPGDPDGGGSWPTYATREHRPFKRAVIRAMEQLTGRPWLGRRYDRALAEGDPTGFFARVLDALDISLDVPEEHLERIPAEGSVLVIANHPFGVVDGLALCSLVARRRSDFRILLHMGLALEPRLENWMLPVDMSRDDQAARINRQTVKLALRTLRESGAILLFPAGGISTAVRLGGEVTDLDWHPLVAKLYRSTRVTVVPVHFGGTNSRLFHTVSQYSPTLRASVLLREMRRMRGQTLRVRVGRPLPWAEELLAQSDAEIIERLRSAVYRVGEEDPQRGPDA